MAADSRQPSMPWQSCPRRAGPPGPPVVERACPPERLTQGDAEPTGAVSGCGPSVQAWPAASAPPVQKLANTSAIKETWHPTAPGQGHNPRTGVRKAAALTAATSLGNHLQPAVSGCWQEPDDSHSLGQGGTPERCGLWSRANSAESAHVPQTCRNSPDDTCLPSIPGSLQNPA